MGTKILITVEACSVVPVRKSENDVIPFNYDSKNALMIIGKIYQV